MTRIAPILHSSAIDERPTTGPRTPAAAGRGAGRAKPCVTNFGVAARHPRGPWAGLIRLVDDGRLGLDTDEVANRIGPVGPIRGSGSFAAHEVAGTKAMPVSPIAECRRSDVTLLDGRDDIPRLRVSMVTESPIADLMPWQVPTTSGLAGGGDKVHDCHDCHGGADGIDMVRSRNAAGFRRSSKRAVTKLLGPRTDQGRSPIAAAPCDRSVWMSRPNTPTDRVVGARRATLIDAA